MARLRRRGDPLVLDPKRPEPEDVWSQYAVAIQGFGTHLHPGVVHKGDFLPLASEVVRAHPTYFRRLEEVNERG